MTADQLAMVEIKNLDTLLMKAQRTGDAKDWEAYQNAFTRTRSQLLKGFWTPSTRPRIDPWAETSGE